MTCAWTGGILMPPKGKWDICPEEKGRMSIMNKKVLGIAAAAAAAGGAVYAASKVKKTGAGTGNAQGKGKPPAP